SRAFYDLAGGDLTDQGVGKQLNGQWRPRVAHFRTSDERSGLAASRYSPVPPAPAPAAITARDEFAICAMRVPMGGLAEK
ncbi:MAG: hypothetical protein JWN58_1289, partial [Gammaproteobacteria bacterium]|nr:hypothetical protein [Gammaproteobacteria bacterium]